MQHFGNSMAVLGMVALIGLFTSTDARACASCGCSVSTDWQSLDYSYKPGLKLDINYNYINQHQLRSGSGTISPVAASQIVTLNGNQEVEQYTNTQTITLGIDYSPNIDWGINLQAPYLIRNHSTLGTASNGIIPLDSGGQYESHTASLGDIKIIGRYQGLLSQHNLGVVLGFKLPTGSYTDTGNSTDPTAPGPVTIDRGLQPGTGTSDVIVGAYYNNAINQNLAYFTQVQYQAAMNSSDHYRPGNSLNVNVGLRYVGLDIVIPQLQLNLRNVMRDTGSNADNVSTGGTLLYITPGIVAAVSDKVTLYAFIQIPVYQYVNGVQLAPYWIPTVGARYAF